MILHSSQHTFSNSCNNRSLNLNDHLTSLNLLTCRLLTGFNLCKSWITHSGVTHGISTYQRLPFKHTVKNGVFLNGLVNCIRELFNSENHIVASTGVVKVLL